MPSYVVRAKFLNSKKELEVSYHFGSAETNDQIRELLEKVRNNLTLFRNATSIELTYRIDEDPNYYF